MSIRNKVLLGSFAAALFAILLVLGIYLDDWGFMILDGTLFGMVLAGFVAAMVTTYSGGL